MTELPLLTGSDKQIAWAAKIRTDLLAHLGRHIAECKARLGGQVPSAVAAQLAAVMAHIESKAAAAWWIERREKIANELLAEAAAEVGIAK